MVRFLCICLGGAAGTGARYLVSRFAQRLFGDAFPYGTLAVNLIGSFLLAAIVHVTLAGDGVSPTLRLALTTGAMGGFTTYSTFSHETMQLLQREAWGLAALNVAITVVACLLVCFLGLVAGRWLVGS